MRQAYADGIAWGDAKQSLCERIDTEVAPLRERYEALIANPARIEGQLRDGARRLREAYATPFLRKLRSAVGLRDLSVVVGDAPVARSAKAALPVFRSEEHTSELQSLMRSSYAVFCLKKKKKRS